MCSTEIEPSPLVSYYLMPTPKITDKYKRQLWKRELMAADGEPAVLLMFVCKLKISSI